MIRIENSEITISGDLETLLLEAAGVVHSVAKAALKRAEENRAKFDYDDIVVRILDKLVMLKKFDVEEIAASGMDELKKDFFKSLTKVREANGRKPTFIDYDTNAFRNIIRDE